MPKRWLPPREGLYPVPVALVSCLDRDNRRANAITIAWCGIVSSEPPQISVSIRPSRYSHQLILREKQFVVNIPSADLLREVDLCGILSGRDTDKLSECSLTTANSSKIDAPMIVQCPVNIECVLKHELKLGSHDAFIGEVVAVHVDGDLLDSNSRIDYDKANPIVFCAGEYWDIGRMIGSYGFSRK